MLSAWLAAENWENDALHAWLGWCHMFYATTDQQIGWKVSHGWWFFSHFRDFSILLAFSPRCSSVFLAGTTMQWFSSWDEASSSMYLGDVSSTELSHLDEEAACISCMSWRGFTTLLHKGVAAAKVEAMQMWWWRGGAHGWRQRLWRAGQGCMCDIFVSMTL